jgi:DNA polymerase-1
LQPGEALAVLEDLTVVYCTKAEEVPALIDEMLQDAGKHKDGYLALDIETAPNPCEVERLHALQMEIEDLKGSKVARRKAKYPLTAQEAQDLAQRLKLLKAKVKYAESAALDPHRAQIRLVQLYGGGSRVAVIDVFRTGLEVLRQLQGASVVIHNAAFELSFFETHVVRDLFGDVHDTMQAAQLTLGGDRTGLEKAVQHYLKVGLDKEQQKSDWTREILSKEQRDYAALDAVALWRLARCILPELRHQTSAYDIQRAAVPVVARMQCRGFMLDKAGHTNLIKALKCDLEEARQSYTHTAKAYNLGTPSDKCIPLKAPSTPAEIRALLKVVLTRDELAAWPLTPKAKLLSTSRDSLCQAVGHEPIAQLPRIARLKKHLSSFGPTLLTFISPITGRIHAHYKVAGTVSGRASCAEPALQQIPRGELFRALFKAAEGHMLVLGDYNMMEMRAAAHISRDPVMTKAFKDGLDLHIVTASHITGKKPEDITKEDRQAAKAVNFGFL